MKSIHNKKNTWEEINKVILRVDNIDLKYEKRTFIFLDCGFENISRGRCALRIKEKIGKTSDDLFIHSDKALMEVNIYYDSIFISKLLEYFSYKKNSTRKIKVILNISDSLMTNNSGDLYINNKVKIKVQSINWDIPIL